jgi:hypothetical protein
MAVNVRSEQDGTPQPVNGSGPPLPGDHTSAPPATAAQHPDGAAAKRAPKHKHRDASSDLLDLPDLPEGKNGAECRLIAEVAVLDNRSLHTFGADSPARKQVKELLRHALHSDLACQEARFLTRATQTFRDRVLSRNRTHYILGVLLGMIPLIVLAVLAYSLDTKSIQHLGLQSPLCCTWTIAFAGMGALCSVFTRLNRIDMCDETTDLFIYLSGVFRPFTAIMFAITIIQILRLNALPIQSGAAQTDELHVHLYFLVAFLSGFSERFASDLIGRAERVVGAPVGAAPANGEPDRPANAGATGPATGQA